MAKAKAERKIAVVKCQVAKDKGVEVPGLPRGYAVANRTGDGKNWRCTICSNFHSPSNPPRTEKNKNEPSALPKAH